MRKALADALIELAGYDERVMLLTADLGFGVWEKFAEKFPGRFINVGCAEQAMIGTATGMAKAGLLPFCYSIANFAMLRPFEFIRNGPVAHQLPVTVIGVGAGTDYSFDGLTHYALEDLAVARTLPGLNVYAPVSDDDVAGLLMESYVMKYPSYFRLSRVGHPLSAPDVRDESPEEVDALVLTHGTSYSRALEMCERIRENGVSAKVLAVKRFSTGTEWDLNEHLIQAKCCLVVEDHYYVGGLSSLAAEVIAINGLATRLVIDAIEKLLIGPVGSPEYMDSRSHRSPAFLAAQVADLVK